MKKLIVLASVLTLVFVLTACGGSDSNSEKKENANQKVTEAKNKKDDKKKEETTEEQATTVTTAKLSYATVNAPTGWSIVEKTINMANLQKDDGSATMKVWCSAFIGAEEFINNELTKYDDKKKYKKSDKPEIFKLEFENTGLTYYGYHPDKIEDQFIVACDAKKGYVEVDGNGVTIDEATGFIQSIQVVTKEKKY